MKGIQPESKVTPEAERTQPRRRAPNTIGTTVLHGQHQHDTVVARFPAINVEKEEANALAWLSGLILGVFPVDRSSAFSISAKVSP